MADKKDGQKNSLRIVKKCIFQRYFFINEIK